MLRVAALLLALVSVACGDNDLGPGLPLAQANDLVLIAHEDDDLLFMQPDVIEAVQRGGGVTNVYVTAGNGTKGAGAANPRYQGLKEAYGAAAGDMDWQCGWIEIDHHVAQHCRLEAENISLVFLAYPDGGECDQYPNSLMQLWDGRIQYATTIADRTATYDQPGLIATVAEIMHDVQPRVIRTLDVTSNHGHDHVDHEIVGALALMALGTTDQQPTVIAYRGYDIASEPANKIQPIFDFVHPILGRYEACAAKCAPCGQSCTTIEMAHDIWLGRRYAFGFRRAGTGVLAAESGTCLMADGSLGDCAIAPVWTIDAHGELATASGCLTVAGDGTLGVTACGGGPSQRMFFDDEGHVWSAMPPTPEVGTDVGFDCDNPLPPPQPGMEYDHLDCLTPSSDGTSASARLCGAAQAPTWQLLSSLVTTPRTTLQLAATGRSVRLGDLTGDGFADLCAVVAGELECAPGDGTGHFGSAAPMGQLAIDPDSLAIGDIDGDGKLDACGRASTGTICALAASNFAGASFATTFGDADARADTAASLQIAAEQVCGADTTGVTCAPSGALLSPWPDPDATVWPADLDGDHAVDWCATGSAGPSCGLASEAGMTTDGVPWMYSNGGTPETVPSDPALTAIADIDGDGNADLCAVVGTGVQCARGQAHGFGPLAAVLATAAPPVALWLGDVNGDGDADECVDLGDSIACAVH